MKSHWDNFAYHVKMMKRFVGLAQLKGFRPSQKRLWIVAAQIEGKRARFWCRELRKNGVSKHLIREIGRF